MAPSGGTRIEWVEATGSTPHQLILRGGAHDGANLLDFRRHADVLWAPDSHAIAITAHEESSDSALSVIRIDGLLERISVEEEFNRTLGKPEAVYKHGHRYFTTARWLSARKLVFDVRAYDADPRVSYRATFVSDLSGTVRRLR